MSTECLPENFVLPPATFPSVKGWWSWSLAATVSAAAIGFCVWGCQSADTLQDNRRCELRYGTFSFGLSADGNTLAVGAAGESGSSDHSLVLLLSSGDLYFTGVSAKVSQWVSPIEFVSDEFGFLLGRSIDPETAERNKWPSVPGCLERFGLDGTRKLIIDSLPSPISSLSVSPNRRLVAVCNSTVTDSETLATCRVYSLDDGSLVSTFTPQNPQTVKLLKAVFVDDADHCLIVSQPMHWADHLNDVSRAYLTDAGTSEVLQEVDIYDPSAELFGLVSSPETGEVFAAIGGVIGRFTVGNGGYEYEQFYSTGAFSLGCDIKWLDYHAGTGRLAVGEIVDGSRRESATRIVDVKTRKAFDTQLNIAGPLKFSPDGKALYVLTGVMRDGRNDVGGVHKYLLDQLR